MAAPASLPERAPVPVPKTNRDPTRSLRPQPVYLMARDRELVIPAMPAADWLSVLMRPGWMLDDLFIELVPDGLQLVMDGIIDPFDEDLMVAILEDVTARHWWIAGRLVGILVDTWDVMGPEATFNGVDPERLSLAAWLDAMLVLLMRRISDDQAAMFVMQLEAPPAGEELPEEELEMSSSQFLSMAD